MYCEFSETQFLFCFLRELLNKNHQISMPFIPTQRKEKTLGYDSRLKNGFHVFFIQFKVPESRISLKAKYYKDFNSLPYYCFKIHNKSNNNQHQTLTQLAKKNPGSVYYCTPAYNTYIELEKSFDSNQIIINSKFIDCGHKNLQNLSTGDHCITFQNNCNKGYIHSNKSEVDMFDYNTIVEKSMYISDEEEFVSRIKETEVNIGEASNICEVSKVLLKKYNIILFAIPKCINI